MLVLLYRWQLAMCEHFCWTPADVEALAWWQFELAIDHVEQAARKAARNG